MAGKGTKRARRVGVRGGFTLLEMMLVLVIIGLLVGVSVTALLPAGAKARKQTTKASLKTIGDAITAYHNETGAYPPTLATLAPGFVKTVGKDAWKREFVYYAASPDPARPFTLVSAGEDGQVNTGDDINYWTMDE